MARITTSSFTYITKNRPNQKAPVRSVVYDGQDRPTQIVYNVAQQGGSETVDIDWGTGHPTIGGIEYRDHVINIWDARLELVQQVQATIQEPLRVTIDPSSGFATQQLDVTTTVVQITNTSNRISLAIRNLSDPTEDQQLYVAEDNTTLTDGWVLFSREGVSIDLDPNASVFLVASSGTIDTRLLEVIS